MQPLVVFTSLAGAAAVLALRLRETSRPVTARKIVIPPLGMSTGLSMFVYPPTRVPWTWGLLAFATGALLLALPLIASSRLVRVGDQIMMQRSKAFLWLLFGLFAVRFAARNYVESHVSPIQTGSLFFLLAFGMIVRWRVTMFFQYRALQNAPAQ